MGVVTPVGSTIDRMWNSLTAGCSGVDYIRRFDASTFPTTFGAEVRDFDETRVPADLKLRDVLDRKNSFGWVAAADALADSRLLESPPPRVGVSIGTESRRPDMLERLSAGDMYPAVDDHLRYSPFVAAAALASHYCFTGPQLTVSTACTSGTQALGVAYQAIQRG